MSSSELDLQVLSSVSAGFEIGLCTIGVFQILKHNGIVSKLPHTFRAFHFNSIENIFHLVTSFKNDHVQWKLSDMMASSRILTGFPFTR